MIRLPPTSIALSENDIQLHLAQASVYEGLLVQGFKKKDIIRYYTENNHARAQHQQRTLNQQHAPRQSSLLRFTKNASPDITEEEDFTVSPRTQAIRYRPRTEPNPYIDSEADDIDRTEDEHLDEDFSHLAIQSSPPLPSRSHSPKSSPSSQLSAEAAVFRPLVTPILAPPQTSSLSNTELVASPPSPLSSPETYSLSPVSHSLQLPPQILRTPTLAQRMTSPRTEPRNTIDMDGTSFDVYNDHLPASTQPQTPADLHRRPLVTSQEAAYTAPPGALFNHPAHSPEPSPTTRAIGMRERRNREFYRSARVAHMVAAETARQRWREELDADRVGEENFEDTIGNLPATEALVFGPSPRDEENGRR